MQIDTRIKNAAKQSTTRIEESMPPSLLANLKELGRTMSVSWLGIHAGLWIPIQYVMEYSRTEVERTRWKQPLIVWPLMHSSSGTRKSGIYRFINSVMNFEDWGDDDEPLPRFKVNETTFENLGIVMEKNGGRVIWMFDEARHFFAQLGFYQKGSSRDETTLLSLYDGGQWDHGTAGSKSAKFSLPRTRIALGGLTQVAHICALFDNPEQMQSGLIPRFTVLMLEPVHTDFFDLQIDEDDEKYHENLFREKLKEIKDSHQGREVVHQLLMNSKAAQLFGRYYKSVKEWTILHEYELAYQDAITLVSKSLGQILRVSGLLNALFLVWNKEEVISYEDSSNFVGDIPVFEMIEVDAGFRIPISLMALQNALSIVTHSVTQNLLLQNIELFRFDFSNDVPVIRDVELPTTETTSSSSRLAQPVTSRAKTSTPSPSLGQQQNQNDLTTSDIKKVLLCGGINLDARYVNNYKKMGIRTNIRRVQEAFQVLQSFAFGVCKSKNLFILHSDLCNRINADKDLKQRLTELGVSLFMLQEAMNKKDSVLVPPKKKIKIEKENCPPAALTFQQSSSTSEIMTSVEPLSAPRNVLLSSASVVETMPATSTESVNLSFTLPVDSTNCKHTFDGSNVSTNRNFDLELDHLGHLIHVTNQL